MPERLMTYDAVIIGGGPAGCSVAAQLAARGHRVVLLEKKTYPAHKLCGEFLSTEVQALFERLGVLNAIQQAGAQPITRARLTTAGGAVLDHALPGVALGLSRYAMDAILFDHARTQGAEARDGAAVREVAGHLDHGFQVTTEEATYRTRLVLGAYGKRDALDRKLNRRFLQSQRPYVAFKAHYEGLALPGVVELHAFPGGYCGLSAVEGGRVNVCWISHERALREAGGDPERMIERVLTRNPYLGRRLAVMRRVSERFYAVSQITMTPKGAFAGDVCMVGDTAGMIAPFCGDGMAMALRGAELAAPLASSFLEEALASAAFRTTYATAWRKEFSRRMWLGRWLHRGFCHPALAHVGVTACRRLPSIRRWVTRQTRGTAEPFALGARGRT